MKVLGQEKSRKDYLDIQVEASKQKIRYCKVSTACVERFSEIIFRSENGNLKGPILCLGTRNGREIDLFRILFFGKRWLGFLVKFFEIKQFGFSCRFPILESFGRSDINKIDTCSVIGVEINPDAKRKDVLVCSFDNLPKEWECKFKIIYANTLDHAQDPYRTAKEWYRVVMPGGYIVLGNGQPGEPHYPEFVGRITLEDIRGLFPGELIYFNKFGNRYADIIIKKDSSDGLK